MKSLITQVGAQAAQSQEYARAEVARASYSTLLLTIHTMLNLETEVLRGWQQAAWLLGNFNRRLLIDMLADPPAEELRLRVATLLDIPDLPPIGSMSDIHEAISSAIRIGAPRYNNGDIRGCCTVYWATIQALIATTPVRGFPGFARAMGELRSLAELEVVPYALSSEEIDNLAWELRQGLDTVLQIAGDGGY